MDELEITTEARHESDDGERTTKTVRYAREHELFVRADIDAKGAEEHGREWWAETEAIDGKDWRPYADEKAGVETVHQLLRKEYSAMY